ncbi:MAG: efflux RND transporter permease subunit [Planctomycetota bacterium]|jgi:multidrug efflux pump subunit AcrB
MSALRAIIAGGVRNPVLVNLLMVCVLIGGSLAAMRMVREAFPEFRLDYLSVTVIYPGASPEDVEKGVCIPIEEAVRGIEGVREITSLANENLGTIWVALKYDVTDVTKVLDDVKERVDQIPNFPQEIEKPIVKEMSLKSEVINVAIHGDIGERTLKRFAQDVKDDLIAMPAISQVSLSGVRDDEIVIEVAEEALLAHQLTMTQLMTIVKRGSLDLPAGSIRTANEEVTLRVTGQRYTAADYEELVVIESPEAIIRLGDIANVEEGFSDEVQRGRFNGEPAALLSVFKTPSEDSKKIARLVRDYVGARQDHLPDRMSMTAWGDTSIIIDSMLAMLTSNGIAGVILVLVTLCIFLESRTAVWVAIGIPISFAGALLVMWFGGETINLISIFALIMVSGIIVDDAIVLADSVHTRRRAGDPPMLASIEGACRVALPVLGASVTTIIAFIPMMYVVGVMGRFIRVLPVVVIAAIVASAVEAFFILPAHLNERQVRGVERKSRGPSRWRRYVDGWIDHVIANWYRPMFRWSVKNRMVTVSLAGAALLIVIGLVVGGRVPLILLPKDETNIITARVRLPEGTPATATQQAIEQVARAAYALNDERDLMPSSDQPLVRHVSSLTGGFSGFVGFVSSRGNNLCEVRVELLPLELRGIATTVVLDRWRELTGKIHDAVEFTIEPQQLGPTDQPIEIRVMGGTPEELKSASERIQARLAQFEGVVDTRDDMIPGKRELRVSLRPAARALGLTLDDVATHLRHGFYGGEVATLQRGRDQVKVRLRYPESQRRSITDLENERIRTMAGGEVPFREVAQVDWARSYESTWRQDGRPRVVVRADLDEEQANANEILEVLESGFLASVVGDYNEMIYRFGGDRERMGEALSSLYDGFTIAIVAIYGVLASMLRSYVQPLVIVIALPFGMVGVVVGHLVMDYNLSLMSIFGAVALSGVVVNDSLVLVDCINQEIRGGRSVREAVNISGELRFRAVVLTSVTTVAGLLPILMEQSSRANSIMPMALALSFGITFATALTLFVVPCCFLLVNDVRRFFRWVRFGGQYPTPEMVEEAAEETGELAASGG